MKSLSQLFSRRRRYTDLSESIREHIDEHIEELVEDGIPRPEAERTARRAFGNVALIEQQSREIWQWPAIESLLTDLRFALRRLRKSPAFTLTVLATLAIGIGANTAVFSVLNRVLIKPLAYPAPGELVDLRLHAPGAEGLANFTDGLRLSTSMYLTFAAHNRSFESMGIFTDDLQTVTDLDHPEEARVLQLSDGFLETLAVQPLIGHRLPHQDPNDNTGHLILSYDYWQRRFAGSPAAIGSTLHLGRFPFLVVGVMPRNFRILNQDFDLLEPMVIDPAQQHLFGFGYQGIARLRLGVTIPQANSDITRLLNLWMNSWSNGPGSNPHFYETWQITPDLRPLKDMILGNIRGVLWVVMATISLVMLIACVNVANLLLVRADARRQELSIRAALGANRARLARELLLESLTLSTLGGLLGIAVAQAALRLLLAYGPANLPRLNEITLDLSSLSFAILLAIFSGLLFGAIPALKYSRAHASLSAAARTSSTSHDRQRSRNLLVVAQVALALVLLVCALLMIRTFAALRSIHPGFSDPEHVETLGIHIAMPIIPEPVLTAHAENNIADKLAAIPGVTSVGFAAAVPMNGAGPDWDEVRVEGKVYDQDNVPLKFFNYVAPGYLQTIGTRILTGRDFTWAEIYALHPTVIVSESFARESWGSAQSALGKRISQSADGPWFEVVGVVEDVYQKGVDTPAPALIYWPVLKKTPHLGKLSLDSQEQIESQHFVTYVLHTTQAGSQTLVSQMQQATWSINSEIPIASVGTMQQLYDKSLARTSFTLTMLAIAGTMALILGILGIYGVISYAVSQRTREIGIRLALGAQKSTLRWIFVRSALLLTGAGVTLGLVIAAGLTQFMKSLLFGISPIDPITFTAIPLVLIAAAAVASYLPARHAASINPTEALRSE
jgi:predicted permease